MEKSGIMKKYTVKLSNGILSFMECRKLKATIERTKDGRWECGCAFHNGQCIGAKYDEKGEAIRRTVEYLESLDLNGEATFNGSSDLSFLWNLI